MRRRGWAEKGMKADEGGEKNARNVAAVRRDET